MKTFLFKKIFWRHKYWIGCVLGLVGCSPKVPPVKGFEYLSEQPVSLSVSAIRTSVLDEKKHSDNVESLMPMPLSSLVSQWSRERFMPRGHGPLMTFRVEEAWIRDLSFSNDNPVYQGKIRITVSVGATQGGISVQSARPISSGLSVIQRRQILQELCEELIASLTKEADIVIPRILYNKKGR